MTWDQALFDFAIHQRAANLSDKTVQNREECLLLLARRTLRPPGLITVADLEASLARVNARTGGQLAAGTKMSERSYFQTFFSWMLSSGRRQDDPAAGLHRIKKPRRRPRPFRQNQVERILDGGSYKRTRDIIIIAALSGLRIGEIVRIRGEDLDIEVGELHTLRKGGVEHIVVLHATLLELAAEYPRQGWWFPSPGTNRLFPDGGGHILMKSASDRVSYAIRQAGIPAGRLTGHSLRHYFATELLNRGVNIRVVQEALGHASLATTQMYTEVGFQQLHEGVATLPAIAVRTRSNRMQLVVIEVLEQVAA
jgi:integrase/recombinase XerD